MQILAASTLVVLLGTGNPGLIPERSGVNAPVTPRQP